MIASAVVCALLFAAVSAAPVTMHLHLNETAPPPPANCAGWTLYKQCDSAWGNDRLGTSSDTICSAGCAMSSVAMLLNTRGVGFNPASLNNWLIQNGGYESGDLIVWSAVDKLGKTAFQGIENPAMSDVIDGLNACHGIIANVRGGTHWVLLTGYAGSGKFKVNDPGFSTTEYAFSDMLRFAVYH
eukprot:m.207899 g.207899  ORF g.207899 m.207899 type:complete len:185 (+) comp16921_c1_seq3:2136-2690(+)